MVATATPIAKALAEVYFTDCYPGFDLDDPDWPGLRAKIDEVTKLLGIVKARVAQKSGVNSPLDSSRSSRRRHGT